MSPNVPWTRMTGTGCAGERQAKSLAPGGGVPGAWAVAEAGAAQASRTAAARTTASAWRIIAGSRSHTRTGRAQTAGGGALTEPEALGQRLGAGVRGHHALRHHRPV